MTDNREYFEYLKERSRLALLYRRYWLYPRLNRHLKGSTLDVGCGVGDFLHFRKGTIGTDINPHIVEWCQKQELDVRKMEPDHLPFADGTFFNVVLDTVLEHISDPKPLMGEIHRVLQAGGTLIVGVPGAKGYASDPDHKHFYDESGLTVEISKHGFERRHMLHMPLKMAWMNHKLRQYCIYGVFSRDHI